MHVLAILGRHLRREFVAYLALFVSLSGTALGASYVIARNGQVGAGTISGSHPPAGKHANIIHNSITASDIDPNSIGGGRIAPDSITGSKIAESTLSMVPSAQKADNAALLAGHEPPTSFHETLGPDQSTPDGDAGMYNTEGLSADFRCNAHASTFTVTFKDANGGPPSSLNWFYSNGTEVKASGHLIDGPGALRTLQVTEPRIEGQFIYRTYPGFNSWHPDNVAFVAFHGYASGNDGFCELHGVVFGSKGPSDPEFGG